MSPAASRGANAGHAPLGHITELEQTSYVVELVGGHVEKIVF